LSDKESHQLAAMPIRWSDWSMKSSWRICWKRHWKGQSTLFSIQDLIDEVVPRCCRH
jgi:hypothetical protein